MTVEFRAIVKLTRLAHTKACDQGELLLAISADSETAQLVGLAHTWLAATVRLNGKERFEPIGSLPVGTDISLEFRPIVAGTRGIFRSLAEMLNYQAGLYQHSPLAEYYLVDEDYCNDEIAAEDSDVARYQRAPELLQTLETVCDVRLTHTPPTFVFLADTRIDVPIIYTRDDLRYLPASDVLRGLAAELQTAPLLAAKKNIFKRVIKRFLEAIQERQRLGQLIRSMTSIIESFHADLALYESEFNFETLRDSFERKRVDYLLKLNAATTDAMSKLLAIPVAQGLLVSQMKVGATIANAALMAGSVVFALIAALILVSQWHSADQISNEIDSEVKDLAQRFPDQYIRLNASYRTLTRRASTAKAAPFVLALLLLVMTIFTICCYFNIGGVPANGAA